MAPNHPTLSPISTMKRTPSPPNTHHHSSFAPSPLSSPVLSSASSFGSSPPSPPSSSTSYFQPSFHDHTPAVPTQLRPAVPERRRSSGGGATFPRSQPLRPMLGLTSLGGGAGTAVQPSEKPQMVPINGMKTGLGKGGKVKMLVGRSMKTTFDLNLSNRELSRAE